MIKSATAQTIPKPSVPQFTVDLSDNSYVAVSIKNQPYYPYVDPNTGYTMQFFYNIRIKNHFEPNNWTELFSPEYYPTMSDSEYTNFSIPIEGSMPLPVTPQIHYSIPLGNQTDIQVQALIGVVNRKLVLPDSQRGGFPSAPYVFNGTESGWSNTQTITISANSPSPTLVPEFSWLVLLPLLLFLISVAALVRHRQVKKP